MLHVCKERGHARELFIVGASYLSLLHTVAAGYGLAYVFVASEVVADGTPVYGVKIEVATMKEQSTKAMVLLTW